ncbi:MAG: hypothetical protein LBR69_05365 [Endomicrobium sp.]|nr:hypothetical protein [Endomicrobium sp.]
MADILIVSLAKRNETAVKTQELLTDFGCIIKTRLGLHESGAACADRGIIILELAPDAEKIYELTKKLETVEGVKTKFVSI